MKKLFVFLISLGFIGSVYPYAADQDVSGLDNLGAAPAANDEILIYDTGAAVTTKALTITNLFTSPTFVTPTIGAATSSSLDNSDGNITNVGEITVDKVDADGAAIAIGDNDETVAIDSNDWDISTTGAISNVSFDDDNNELTNIDGENIKNDTIDDDSIDFGSGADQVDYSDITTGNISTAGTIEGGTITEGGVAVYNDDEIDEKAELENILTDVSYLVVDATDCTDIEGTGLTITGGVLGIDANYPSATTLDAMNAPSDEYAYTYEASTGRGEWQSTAGSGDMLKATYDTDSDGDIDQAAGGLEADVSAYTGLIGLNAGAVTEVDTEAELETTLGGLDVVTITASDISKANLETALSDVADIAEADGDTWTGVHDAGGADSFEIVNGAAPTVDANGEIAVDTTSGQLVYYSGAKRVLPYEDTKCFTIENLAAADDSFEFGMFNDAVTITAVSAHCRGTCTTPAQISLEDRAGNAMTHAAFYASSGTGNSNWVAVTANNQLAAGEGIAFDVDNTPDPETDEYTICTSYTCDAD